jgi:ankyrin repeat protein
MYKLLLSAGASRVPQIHLACPESQMEHFWIDYVSQDYEISAEDVLLDYTYQLGSLPHNQLFSRHGRDSIQTTILDYQSLTRLQKCTIGLTSETIEDVIALSWEELNATDSLGRTALHFAAYQCSIDAMALLLKHGANPDLIDDYGKAPLHIAAGLGSIPITKTLITSRCDLEIRDQFWNTPIHLACLMGHVHTVELLLDAGADSEALNAHGETPVRQAILNDRLEVAQLLHQRGAAFSGFKSTACAGNPMIKAVWFNSHRIFRFLMSLHIRVDQRHKSGRTILHTLADNGDALTMKIFLEVTHPSLARLDVDELDSRGWTAMDYLKSRRDAHELMEPFIKVVEHVQRACALQAARSKEIFTSDEKVILGSKKQDVFFDAVESQEGV